ncbi:GNAT family N-acetyltransferase [Microbacterium aurantiacum]|uniref:GNAT family N-acetyltransferase n=1 Tax=Microbacterium aurantiacum TaxID=162393 RepID=UPI000C80C2AA|nr:GNAT family N-acetyltransferase [Microbacterium aurantiacum]
MDQSEPHTVHGEPQTESPIEINEISPEDAGEVLTLQRAAFVSEAIIYGSPDIPPLTQTLEELEAELRAGAGLTARIGCRLVGAIRYQQDGDMLLIGRIAIAPDMQGEGIGTALLEAAEAASTASVSELFTGSLSTANIRLYESCGYRESDRVADGDGTEQVFLRKPLRHM